MTHSTLQHTAAIEWFKYLIKHDDPRVTNTMSRLESFEKCVLEHQEQLEYTIKPVSLTHKQFYENTPLWRVSYRDFTCDIQLQDCAHWEYLSKKRNPIMALKQTIHDAIARNISGKNTLQYHKSILKSHRKKTAYDFFKQFNVFHGYDTLKNMIALCEQHPILGDYINERFAVRFARGLRRLPLREQLFLMTNKSHTDNTWRALPWEPLQNARAAWRKEGLGTMGAHQQWQHLLGFPLTNYHFNHTFVPSKFKLKTWTILIEKYKLAVTRGPRKGYVDSGIGHPLINLIHIFDTPENIENMLLTWNTYQKTQNTWYHDRSNDIPYLLHKIGDFTLFRPFTDEEKQTIVQWCHKKPMLLQHLGDFQKYLQEHTLTTIDDFLMTYHYKNQSPLAALCLKLNMSKYDFIAYEHFWETHQPKQEDYTPNVRCESSQFIIRKLEPTDLRGPMLGLYTSCCQHLHSTAKKTAINGVVSPHSAFYVLTDTKDNIMSQCYLWKNTNGDIIIDSIEGIFQKEDKRWNEVVQIWKDFVLAMSEHCAVYLGDTPYGLTADITKAWKDDIRFAWTVHETTPQDEDSYFDGLKHFYLCGEPVSLRKKNAIIESINMEKI